MLRRARAERFGSDWKGERTRQTGARVLGGKKRTPTANVHAHAWRRTNFESARVTGRVLVLRFQSLFETDPRWVAEQEQESRGLVGSGGKVTIRRAVGGGFSWRDHL